MGNAPENDNPAIALRIDSVTIHRGDVITITLTNVSDEFVDTGNKNCYNLVVKSENGWEDVRVWQDEVKKGYPDSAFEIPPGHEVEWSLEMSESGLLAGHYYDYALEVCPDLPEGRYAFVVWPGLSVPVPVAVGFDLRR